MHLTKNQLNTLSNIFSPNLIRELLKFQYSEKLKRILHDTQLLTIVKEISLKELFEFSFKVVEKEYPNEYIYKNAIANKILLGIHNLNTSFMITEFQAKNSKVDCVIINGTLTVYEIKTEFDNFQRLEKQLSDYKKVFEKINIITSPRQADKLTHFQDEGIGIIILNKNGTLSTRYKAQSNFDKLELSEIFDSLRQSEYIQIINNIHGSIPNVPNTKLYTTCKKIFCSFDKKEAYKQVVYQLKQRGNIESLKNFITLMPKSLKVRALDSKFSKKEQTNLIKLLDQKAINFINKG